MHKWVAKSLQGALEMVLNKHTPTPAGLIRAFLTFCTDRLVYWTHHPALECDSNYSPPVALFLDDAHSDFLLPTVWLTRVVRNIEFMWVVIIAIWMRYDIPPIPRCSIQFDISCHRYLFLFTLYTVCLFVINPDAATQNTLHSEIASFCVYI